MKFGILIFSFLLAFTAASHSQTAFNGVDNDGFIGVYDINDQHYWWLCVEPNGSPAPIAGDGFLGDALSLTDAWTRQNTERNDYYTTSPDALAAQAALGKQINIMEYVLDTYLPIATLTTPGALLEGSENAGHYGNNETFYNSMFAVQNFLAEVYGKPTHTDFTDLGDFADRWSGDLSEAGLARSSLFQSILLDVADKDGLGFFASYDVVNDYYIANTLFPEGDAFNYQDALIIVAPVPEPGGALLIGCFGLAVMLRRWRKLS
ncbi:hypothetical protein WJU23_06540 [Prosthecobacter sp. SYSU 5D2]|uniref:hypothetical protein n=1 Tax=Prosthecobacter sp. SYSU 5D2 TaxID=3134134 RepID=UPI0031FEB4F6